ncbi:MAG TPA: hypothetical protein VGF33_12080 [Caulobacteraceae bacterium]|jgi:hypothetical protein
MMLGNQEKASVLISALEARYRALDAIRDRAQGVCIWALGLLLAAAGWLVAKGQIQPADQTAVACVGIAATWIVLRLVFLADLQRGFRAQQKVAAGLEEALGLYAPGRFGPDSEPLFPEAWRQAGSKGGRGRFFQSTYLLLDVGLLMLLTAVLSRSDWVRAWALELMRALKI